MHVRMASDEEVSFKSFAEYMRIRRSSKKSEREQAEV